VQQLLDATRKGVISWQETASSDAFTVALSLDYSFIVCSNAVAGGNGREYILRMYDLYGAEVFAVPETKTSFTESTVSAFSSQYQSARHSDENPTIKALYEAARDSARNVDAKIVEATKILSKKLQEKAS
jgi:hypothetical protein